MKSWMEGLEGLIKLKDIHDFGHDIFQVKTREKV